MQPKVAHPGLICNHQLHIAGAESVSPGPTYADPPCAKLGINEVHNGHKDEAAARVNATTQAGQLHVDSWDKQQSRRFGFGAANMNIDSSNAIIKAAGNPTIDYSALETKGPALTDFAPQR
jgi:hypothetical protein